ncbi:MAG: hypothetical protein R3B52_00615 [Candidatus Paceibacterota bacterium]
MYGRQYYLFAEAVIALKNPHDPNPELTGKVLDGDTVRKITDDEETALWSAAGRRAQIRDRGSSLTIKRCDQR